ncbi:MAG: fused MFS/spermidine synthase [Hyphomicrobiales bacterium]|nr:fused MFS/spermidine synthase [Hyphomicrobiales bacterium]
MFALTVFLSAMLLFAVQPMFSKMVLPLLGGAPTVWSVAMVSFQAALLVGYLYAHLLVRWVSLERGALVHLGVLACAAVALPIAVAPGFATPPSAGVALWLVGLFVVSIGLPFAALSASAPLLQSWFAASGLPRSENPYILYAASNLGSFAALLSYPVVIEPWLPLQAQSSAWSIGFAAIALLFAMASLFVVGKSSPSAKSIANPPVAWADRLTWVALSAVPAGLVIAVTSYLTTDIAAAPFLWVIPLALYLLSFVGVFRERPWVDPAKVAMAVPFVVAPLAIGVLGGERQYWAAMIAINLVAFFLLATLCHGEVYRRRPAPARLTEFYLLVSLGGVIGGVLAALVAPAIFARVYEYPVLIVAALIVLPGVFSSDRRALVADVAPPLLLAIVAVFAKVGLDIRLPAAAELPFQALLVGLVALMLLQRRRVTRFVALVGLAFVLTALWQPGFRPVETSRSFFGVHQVVDSADGSHRILYHGTTIHGAQRLRDADASRPEPLTYYAWGGPISEAITAARAIKGSLGNVAAVGLGSGSLACHRREGESWTFFEIDPEVVRIAGNPRLFTFLSSCAPDARIVLGDARLTLAAETRRFDLIIVDAFSSDAIPVHLMTRQAVAAYRARLSAEGVLIMHISNRHMELASVVAAVGAAEGLVTYVGQDERSPALLTDFKSNALVAALARSPAHLGNLVHSRRWGEVRSRVAPWTDDYSDLVGAILRKKFGS